MRGNGNSYIHRYIYVKYGRDQSQFKINFFLIWISRSFKNLYTRQSSAFQSYYVMVIHANVKTSVHFVFGRRNRFCVVFTRFFCKIFSRFLRNESCASEYWTKLNIECNWISFFPIFNFYKQISQFNVHFKTEYCKGRFLIHIFFSLLTIYVIRH